MECVQAPAKASTAHAGLSDTLAHQNAHGLSDVFQSVQHSVLSRALAQWLKLHDDDFLCSGFHIGS
jgi:hypothetical protein